MSNLRKILLVGVITSLCLAMIAAAQDAPVGRGGMGMRGAAPGGRGAAPGARGMRGMGGRGAAVRSPEIADDKTVTFRISAPEASSVSVSGDWGGMGGARGGAPGGERGAAPAGERGARGEAPAAARGGVGMGRGGTQMVKDPNGLWSVTVGPLESEMYGYTFNIDGAQVWDPANSQLKRDGTRITSVLIIPGEKGDLYSIQDVPHGTLAKVWYESPTLNLTRRMYVYTPPGYETSGESYPVFYLLHGGGGDEDAWTTLGRAPQILDNLIAQGKAKPMIVVMTNGNPGQAAYAGANPAAGGNQQNPMSMTSGSFEASLVNDVIPFIEKSYRVLSNQENRAVAGLSMGGMQTQTLAINNPELFGYIGVFSMGLQMELGDAAALEEAYNTKLEALKSGGYKLYRIFVGRDDFVYEGVQYLRQKLDEHDFEYVYTETSGGHSWNNWRIFLSQLAPLLFKEGGSGEGGVAGKWSGDFDTQIGLQSYVYTFNVDGDEITGTAEVDIAGQKSESVLADITIEGNEIRFNESQNYQGMGIDIVYVGQITGNEIQFTRTVAGSIVEEFVATRMQE